MSCPDEDTFARFVEGLLAPRAAAEIERHVDACPRCADLAAEFGRSFAEPAAGHAAGAPGRRLTAFALGAGALVHVAWAVVLGDAGAAGVIERLIPPPLAAAYLRYAAIWAPLGGVVALAAAAGLLRGWRWGRVLAVAHAIGSLPSIVLTPLAIFVLAVLRRDHSRRKSSDEP